MLDTKLQNHIVQIYDEIDNIISIEEVKEGFLSQNHILNTKDNKYFLKKYKESYTESEIVDIHKVKMFFSNNEIPVVTPIKDKQDNSYFIFNSGIYTLFPFINAKTEDRKNLSDKSIKSLATSLAKIHLLSKDRIPFNIENYQSAISSEKFLNTYPEILKILNSKKEYTDFDKLALKILKLKKSIVDKSAKKIEALDVTTNHLLHGDYHEKNIFFDNNDEVQYIFDWEMTKIGDRLHELIRSMDYIFLNGEYEEENMNKARIYLLTYKELYPFEKESFINALERYYFKKAHSLWIEGEHYLKNNDRVDCFLEKQLAVLQYFPENLESLINNLDV